MKRFSVFILLLLIIITLSACNKSDNTKQKPETDEEIVIKLPSDNTVNGYLKQPSTSDSENAAYKANKNSAKFHKKDCRYALDISEENLITSSNREFLINNGYAPCKSCNP